VSLVERFGELSVSAPQERGRQRGDAARNRALLLDAARRLVAECGAEALTMDDVAAAAGVGKGTVFRRFGSRAGLMTVLLDEDERANQQAFLFGRERIRFAHTHHELLSAANRDPLTRHNGAMTLLHTHVRMLLAAAASTGDLDVQTDALLALLDADYVEHRLRDRGQSLQTLGDGWESLARKLCGR
jgi:AcrR family transcriptional regulator